jgi:hypothetical protein
VIIRFNTNYLRDELWFDLNPNPRTGPVPTNCTNAMSVCLHEIGYALVYNGWVDLNIVSGFA